MQLIFDYGDEWSFEVEFIKQGQKVPRKRYPSTVETFGNAPEQYPDYEDENDDDSEDHGINLQTGQIISFPRSKKL